MSAPKRSFPMVQYRHSHLGETRTDAILLKTVKDVSGLVEALDRVARRLEDLASELKGHEAQANSVIGGIHLYQATEHMKVACQSIRATLTAIERHNSMKEDYLLEFHLFTKLDQELVTVEQCLEEVRTRLRAFNNYRLNQTNKLDHLLVEAGTVRSKVLLHLGHVKQYHAYLQAKVNAK